jgi:hypothetical protein
MAAAVYEDFVDGGLGGWHGARPTAMLFVLMRLFWEQRQVQGTKAALRDEATSKWGDLVRPGGDHLTNQQPEQTRRLEA